MRLLGYLTADGTFSNTNNIDFSNSESKVINNFNTDIKQLFGVDSSKIKHYPQKVSKGIDHRLCKRNVCEPFYKKHGITRGLAKDKTIPYTIRVSNLQDKRVFIQSYMDLESSVDADETSIEVSSASHVLLFQLKLMLQLDFGIVSRIFPTKVKLKHWTHYRTYYKLAINRDNFVRYCNVIGSGIGRLKTYKKRGDCSIPNTNILVGALLRSMSFSNRRTHNLMGDVIDEKCDLTYRSWTRIKSAVDGDGNPFIKELIDSYFENNLVFDQVTSNVRLDPVPTFDFAMSKTASFIANGICSHNTTLVLHIVAEFQHRHNTAATFIDAEHCLDLSYAKKLGVKTGKNDLLVSQPDYGEQGLEIIRTLQKVQKTDPSVPALIVVDSVDALVPKIEIDGEIDNLDEAGKKKKGSGGGAGLQARMMSQSIRKINGALPRSNMTIIFINQLRAKINMGGFGKGAKSTTSGGNALRFYAGMRIKNTNMGQEEYGLLNGNKIQIKVAKSKVAAPFGEWELFNLPGFGFQKEHDLFEFLKDKGFAEVKGSWVTIKDLDFKCQGFPKFMEKVKNDKKLEKELRNLATKTIDV